MKITKYLALPVLLTGLAFSSSTIAHGNKAGHAAKKSEAVVEKEQTDWGIAGDAADAKRTVTVAMLDKMRFEPASVKVVAGQTIRFVIQNKGQIMHEFVLGDKQSLDDHAALMIKFPNMEHDEPYMAHVAPGESGEIIWKFNRGGDFSFACLIPGHYQAGMIGTLEIAGKSGAHGHGTNHANDDHPKSKKKKHAH